MDNPPPQEGFNDQQPVDEYKTIDGYHRSEIKIKGSRFIASVDFTDCTAKAEGFINRIGSEFHDATHNCFAYRIGVGKDLSERYNDDREPSGTAGLPVLNALKSSGLTNITAVVTRYFGGTKLGTGNLARAYAGAVIEAIHADNIVSKIMTDEITFIAPAGAVSSVYRNLSIFNGKMVNETYIPDGKFKVRLRLSNIGPFKESLIEATNGKVKFES